MTIEEVKLARTAKGKKPQYFSDPAIDKLLSIVMTLTEELSVTRDRLDTLERLIERHDLFSRDEIDNMKHDEQAEQQRTERRTQYLDRVLRTIQMDLEQTTGKDMPESFEDLLRHVV